MAEMISDVNTQIKVSPFKAMQDPIYQRRRQMAKYKVDPNLALQEQARERVATQETIQTEVPRLFELQRSGVQRRLQRAAMEEAGGLQERKHAFGRKELEESLEAAEKGQRLGSIFNLAGMGLNLYETELGAADKPLGRLFGESETQRLEREAKAQTSRQLLLQDEQFAERATDYIAAGDQMAAFKLIQNVNDPNVQARLYSAYADAFVPDIIPISPKQNKMGTLY